MEEALKGEIYLLRLLIAEILELHQEDTAVNSWIKEQLEEIENNTAVN